MGFVKTKDGVNIFYKDWGSGRPVVFSHGWPLSADAWDSQMLFLLQHGYRVIVPEECSGDRAPGPHEANLFDMNQKYADVLPNDEVVSYLESLPQQQPAV